MGIFTDIGHYLRVFREYLGWRLYFVFVLTVLAALAEGFGIALLLPLLQATEVGAEEIDGGIQQVLYDLLQWMGIADSIVWILAFIGIVFLAKGLLKFAERGYFGFLQAQLLRELKSQLYDAYNRMDYRYYIRRNTGHFINVINGQIDGFYRSFERLIGFLSTFITMATYFGVAFLIAWEFALMAVGVGVVILFLFKYLNVYVRSLSRNAARERSTMNSLLVQALQGFKYISATDQKAHLREGVIQSIGRYTGYELRKRIAAAFTSAIKEPVSIFVLIAVIIIQVAVFEAAIAPIFVALILFHRGMQSVIAVQGQWQQTMDTIGSLEMVDDEFAALRQHQEMTGTQKIRSLQDEIVLDDVSFSYTDDGDRALQEVDITIPANTTVAFVGESGAGKSTLIDMLALLLRPQQGEIRIDGVPGSEIELSSWRSQIGYVSQEAVMFDDTVANNICLWRGDVNKDSDVRAKVEEAAKKAYAHHFIMDLPEGFNTVIGDRGVRLSGGQRQRLFIARELFKNPNLLLLDEATSSLDTESERFIQESIDALKGQMTVVIIAHRLSTIREVDYLYVLEKGRVLEEGSYQALTTNGETRFRKMVEMQQL